MTEETAGEESLATAATPPAADQAPSSGAAPAAPRTPVATQVLRFANKVHGQLKDWGRADLGGRISAEAAEWDRQELVVVACGDIKRGKSSLLNAVLGQRELLPVDADVATSVHLLIRHGEQAAVIVTRLGPDGEPVTQLVPPTEIVNVASMQGDAADREGVVSVEIRLPHPLLARGVVLVDTPGVGGMTRGHRDLALAALARADVLLFTVSATEPVARTELEFLAEASERTDRIVLVVTKADANDDETNAAMVAEHRAKLAAFTETMIERAKAGTIDADVPARLHRVAAGAPVVVTSSYLATQARRRHEAGREEQARSLIARSGIPTLSALLVRSTDNREAIRLANLLTLLGVLLADVERQVQALVRAASGDTGVAEDLAGRQRELEQFGSKQARWRATLGNSIVRLQTGSSRLVTRELNRVRDHYREMIEQTADTTALAETIPAELERSLHGAWNELVTAVNDQFSETLGALLDDFGAAGMDIVLGEMEIPEGLHELTRSGRTGDTAADSRLLDDGLPVMLQTFSFGGIANAMAGMLGLATGGLGLLAYGIGAAVALPIGALRRRTRERRRLGSELQRLVNDLLFGSEGIAKEFTTELSLRILDLREQVELYVDKRLAERRKQLEAETRELQQVMRSETGKRQEVQRSARARIDQIAQLRKELETIRHVVVSEYAPAR